MMDMIAQDPSRKPTVDKQDQLSPSEDGDKELSVRERALKRMNSQLSAAATETSDGTGAGSASVAANSGSSGNVLFLTSGEAGETVVDEDTIELEQARSLIARGKPLEGKIKRVVDELVITERDYIRDLNSIITGYQDKMVQSMPESEFKILFSNIRDLHAFHEEFLAAMEGLLQTAPYFLGEAFTEMGERFMIYEKYYNNHPNAVEYLQSQRDNSRFCALLKGCQLLLGHQLPLADYLLKPVQRLLKYPLLLKELIKAADPEEDGYLEFTQANVLIRKVAERINECKRSADMALYVKEVEGKLVGWDGPALSTFGTLIDCGDFKMTDGQNKKQQRKLLLFTDRLMILKTRPGGDFSVKNACGLDSFFIHTMVHDPYCFKLTTDSSKVIGTFSCKAPEEKTTWVRKIKKVMVEFYTSEAANGVVRPEVADAGLTPKQRKKQQRQLRKVTGEHAAEASPRSPKKFMGFMGGSSNSTPASPSPAANSSPLSPTALEPSSPVAADSKAVVQVEFDNDTHTKVIVALGKPLRDAFTRPLAKRGYSVDKVRLCKVGSEDLLDWDADGSVLGGCRHVRTVVKVPDAVAEEEEEETPPPIPKSLESPPPGEPATWDDLALLESEMQTPDGGSLQATLGDFNVLHSTISARRTMSIDGGDEFLAISSTPRNSEDDILDSIREDSDAAVGSVGSPLSREGAWGPTAPEHGLARFGVPSLGGSPKPVKRRESICDLERLSIELEMGAYPVSDDGELVMPKPAAAFDSTPPTTPTGQLAVPPDDTQRAAQTEFRLAMNDQSDGCTSDDVSSVRTETPVVVLERRASSNESLPVVEKQGSESSLLAERQGSFSSTVAERRGSVTSLRSHALGDMGRSNSAISELEAIISRFGAPAGTTEPDEQPVLTPSEDVPFSWEDEVALALVSDFRRSSSESLAISTASGPAAKKTPLAASVTAAAPATAAASASAAVPATPTAAAAPTSPDAATTPTPQGPSSSKQAAEPTPPASPTPSQAPPPFPNSLRSRSPTPTQPPPPFPEPIASAASCDTVVPDSPPTTSVHDRVQKLIARVTPSTQQLTKTKEQPSEAQASSSDAIASATAATTSAAYPKSQSGARDSRASSSSEGSVAEKRKYSESGEAMHLRKRSSAAAASGAPKRGSIPGKSMLASAALIEQSASYVAAFNVVADRGKALSASLASRSDFAKQAPGISKGVLRQMSYKAMNSGGMDLSIGVGLEDSAQERDQAATPAAPATPSTPDSSRYVHDTMAGSTPATRRTRKQRTSSQSLLSGTLPLAAATPVSAPASSAIAATAPASASASASASATKKKKRRRKLKSSSSASSEPDVFRARRSSSGLQTTLGAHGAITETATDSAGSMVVRNYVQIFERSSSAPPDRKLKSKPHNDSFKRALVESPIEEHGMTPQKATPTKTRLRTSLTGPMPTPTEDPVVVVALSPPPSLPKADEPDKDKPSRGFKRGGMQRKSVKENVREMEKLHSAARTSSMKHRRTKSGADKVQKPEPERVEETVPAKAAAAPPTAKTARTAAKATVSSKPPAAAAASLGEEMDNYVRSVVAMIEPAKPTSGADTEVKFEKQMTEVRRRVIEMEKRETPPNSRSKVKNSTLERRKEYSKSLRTASPSGSSKAITEGRQDKERGRRRSLATAVATSVVITADSPPRQQAAESAPVHQAQAHGPRPPIRESKDLEPPSVAHLARRFSLLGRGDFEDTRLPMPNKASVANPFLLARSPSRELLSPGSKIPVPADSNKQSLSVGFLAKKGSEWWRDNSKHTDV